jgi:hypothetical protein
VGQNFFGRVSVKKDVVRLGTLPAGVIVAVGVLGGISGGGGGARVVDFLYETDWGFGLGGGSQVVRLVNPVTGEADIRLLNNDTGGVQSLVFPGVRVGTYELHGTLYSARNGQGSIIGEFRDWVRVQADSSRYRTAVGGTAGGVRVLPERVTIRVQQTAQLYGTVRDTAGRTLFVAQGRLAWESLSAHVQVSGEGIVVGKSAGEGVVRVTDTASGLSATAMVTVLPVEIRRTKWTVMVFLNAANDLDTFSDLNVNQMERVANNPEVRFLVQWKRVQSLGFGAPWTGTRRYLVKYDPSGNNTWSGVRSELLQDLGSGVDMGRPETLRDFVNWVMTYYPADRYVLVVWNHGSGWRFVERGGGTRGVSFDDEFGTYIRTWELPTALNVLEKIDVVSWDASLMQMLEVAGEIQDYCDYMVGSEESPPAEGLPYHLVFGPLRNNPDMPTEEFLRSFGEGMLQFYGESRKITQSSVRMSDLSRLISSVDALGGLLLDRLGLYDNEIRAARSESQSYSPSAFRVYRDLWHLAYKLREHINDAEIDQACEEVMNAVEASVVWNHHNSLSPNSHGLSIEFGDRTQPYWSEYGKLRFSQLTRWDDFLRVAP